ncbi:DUF192 domain-containing protein [Magnetospirillum molischianum]|uniref:DUF192 domain-containing protein n=1 Tax=Magnetospirillum molischianum DSM 120 TaxID=1150626 RepID=H8FUI8_MAGML|nr:DUF192 domain-containing protein [Magnetospirillum molischianum]CCG42026.1 conserved exported hypothetical protein [Magnetospirillum molischianum DSM 120]
MSLGRVGLALALLFGVLTSSPVFAAAAVEFGSSRVELVAAKDGHRTALTVELATTPEQLEQGLMFRRHLAPGSGMLFDFGQPRMVAMWMKNTLIPLDMLFIDVDGRVVHIEENAEPGTLQPRGPVQKVLGVLELPAGSAARLGLRLGDRVEHPMFQENLVKSR